MELCLPPSGFDGDRVRIGFGVRTFGLKDTKVFRIYIAYTSRSGLFLRPSIRPLHCSDAPCLLPYMYGTRTVHGWLATVMTRH